MTEKKEEGRKENKRATFVRGRSKRKEGKEGFLSQPCNEGSSARSAS